MLLYCYGKVKLAVSGSWESALLKVTWPDDLPPDETLVRVMGGARVGKVRILT